MDTEKEFYACVPDELWAQTVGEELLRIAKARDWMRDVDSRAVRLLEKIQGLLDDESLNDRDCFLRMEELLAEWERAGLRTRRHQETE